MSDAGLLAGPCCAAPAGDGGLREAPTPKCTCDEPIIGGSETQHPNDFRDPECPTHRRKPAAGGSTQAPGPAVDLIEHAAGIIVESRKQPFTAPGHWAGALWEAGMLVAPGSAHPAAPAVPQPVDREALTQAIVKAAKQRVAESPEAVWVDGWAGDFADAMLAVLAGGERP